MADAKTTTASVVPPIPDIVHELESLPNTQARQAWRSLSPQQKAQALPLINKQLIASLLKEEGDKQIAEIAGYMLPRDIVRLIELVSNNKGTDLLDSLDGLDRQRVEQNLYYPEGTVGRIIGYATTTTKADRTVGHVLEYFRTNKLPPFTDRIFVIGKRRKLIGVVSLAGLLESPLDTKIGDLQRTENLVTLSPMMSKSAAAELFKNKHYGSLPVVDENNILLGRVTVDKVMEVVSKAANQQVLKMAGLNEELDLFSPVVPSARRRAVWLGINLLTAVLASWSIGLFSATLEQIVALAILMPIVASMGGIAGSQTLTLTIRGLALKKVNRHNRSALLRKEVGVALLNGALWSLVVGLIAWGWFSDPKIAAIIAIAIFGNSVTAAFTGWAIPMVLKAMNIDPAIAGSVILTTFTDIIGFVLFLGLATLWLL